MIDRIWKSGISLNTVKCNGIIKRMSIRIKGAIVAISVVAALART
jgi:hypothetical protein